MLPATGRCMFQDIKASLQQLYLEDERPWLVGLSGGKDSTMLASLIIDAVLAIPAGQRKMPISVLCTDTRVEIPAIAEMIEGTLDRCRKGSQQNGPASGLWNVPKDDLTRENSITMEM